MSEHAERNGLPALIESSHGTVCSACRLWPDTCTCNPRHALRKIFRGVSRALLARHTPKAGS